MSTRARTAYSEFIQRTLDGASILALEHFGRVSATTKTGDNNQILTEADLAIGRFITQEIKRAYPAHNIIDEEADVIDNGSELTWVVDPVDGTSNFANGSPLYGILLGLLEDGQPVAGGIALPAFEEVYVASRGSGAYCKGRRIYVTTRASLMDVLVAYGIDGHQENPEITHQETKLLADIVLRVRNIRSSNSVFDAALTAKGSYGASLNRTSKIWDNVAQQVIIEEAGGTYTDFFGNPMDYSHPLTKAEANFTWCAAAPALHEQLQKIINR